MGSWGRDTHQAQGSRRCSPHAGAQERGTLVRPSGWEGLGPRGTLVHRAGGGGKALHLPSCQPVRMAQVPHQGRALSQGSPAARRSQEDKSGGAEVETLTFQEGMCFLPQVRVLLTPEKKIYSFNYYSSKQAAGSVGTPAAGKHPPSSQQGASHPCGGLGGWSLRWWGVSWALAHTGDRPPPGLCSQSHLPAPACPEVGRAKLRDWPPAAKKADSCQPAGFPPGNPPAPVAWVLRRGWRPGHGAVL